MEYYGHNDWRDYHLAHYGRKGMQWGKHKFGINPFQLQAFQNINQQVQAAASAQNQARANEATTKAQMARQSQIQSQAMAAEARAKAQAAQKAQQAQQIQQKAAPDKLGVPAKIQQEIGQTQAKDANAENQQNASNKSASDVDKMADAVINGKYGNGEARKKALEKEGYNWAEVQNKVNEKLGSSVRHAVDEIGSQSVNDSDIKSSAASGKAAVDGIKNAYGHGAKVNNSKGSNSSKNKNNKPKTTKEKKKANKKEKKGLSNRASEATARRNMALSNQQNRINAATNRQTVRSRTNKTLRIGPDGEMIYR